MTRKIERRSPAGQQITRPPLSINHNPMIHISGGDQSAPAVAPSSPLAAAERPWVQLGTYVPEPLKKQLKIHCTAQGIEIRDAVTTAIGEWLANQQASQRAGSQDS